MSSQSASASARPELQWKRNNMQQCGVQVHQSRKELPRLVGEECRSEVFEVASDGQEVHPAPLGFVGLCPGETVYMRPCSEGRSARSSERSWRSWPRQADVRRPDTSVLLRSACDMRKDVNLQGRGRVQADSATVKGDGSGAFSRFVN